VDAVIREMKEETSQFEGELRSSQEGKMYWIDKTEQPTVKLVNDFDDLLNVMLDNKLSEFQYVIDGEEWKIIKK